MLVVVVLRILLQLRRRGVEGRGVGALGGRILR